MDMESEATRAGEEDSKPMKQELSGFSKNGDCHCEMVVSDCGAANIRELKSEVSSPSLKSEAQPAEPMDAESEQDTKNGTFTTMPITSNGTASSAPALCDKESSDDEEDNIAWSERIKTEGTPKLVIKVPKEVKEVKAEPKAESITPNATPSSSAGKRKSSASLNASANKKARKAKDYSSEEEEEEAASDEEDEEYSTSKKKTAAKKKAVEKAETKKRRETTPNEDRKREADKKKKAKKEESSSSASPAKRKKKGEEEPEEIWRWWEEEKNNDGVKWRTLEHKGPLFAPPYVRWPKSTKFFYDGEAMELSERAEEVASFYGRMLDHEYTKKETFNRNFFKDWRKTMTAQEREKLTDLTKCDFSRIHKHYLEESEKRKAMSKEEKLKIKEEKDKETKEYGFAVVDGHRQKIGNFRIEPPGLFRGRGDHPKMGKLKKRVRPEDVTINCSKGSKVPTAPAGHQWKEVRHDNTVTWLSSWTENVLGSNKYIMLNPSSKIKGEKDYEKFETARRLREKIGEIRSKYTEEFKAHEMRVRQRAVALYFIDKLALRAGNEKDTDEAADTVGCCSLRIEHIKLFDELNDQKYVVDFDFLGKDSIRYQNTVPVEKAVYRNLKLFMKGREGSDNLFDRLDTTSLNAYLKSLMPGLSAKVFRTYNASNTLQEQLNLLTQPRDSVHEKMLSYNRANRQVAILCNHQRAIPKSHEKSMENLGNKLKQKKAELKELKKELKNATKSGKEKIQKRVDRMKDQVRRMVIQQTDKDENKTIALGTSKLNYLDPRITIAWCKKHGVGVEKIFNKTHREKFRWAIDMTDGDYEF